MAEISARKRHKIVLYNPQAVFFDMPLALLAVGSAVPEDQYHVVLIDARTDADAHARLREECRDALCLGITSLSGAPLQDALSATRMVKGDLPDLPIVWGGWHPSLFPKDTLAQEPSIDICVNGQGEVTFLELVNALRDKTDLARIHGISYRADGQVKQTPPRTLQDQDTLAPINYDLIDPEVYFAAKGQRQLDYISSTGCFFRCTFCADPFVFKRRWTAISPERVVEEITAFHARHAITDVNFQDETFFTYRNRCVAIAEGLVERKLPIRWAATMRADQGSRLSDADFELLKRSGLRRLLIGVESGSQEMMDWLKKDIKVEQVMECAERCKRLGIHAIFPFIVGFPGESDASVQASLEFIKTLRAKSSAFQTPVFYFKPYPGTQITAEAEKDGYQLPQSLEAWSQFDYVGSEGGPWVDDRKYQLIERFKFYANLAWGRPHPVKWPLQALARLRCRHDQYGLPFEKAVLQHLRKNQSLS